MLTNQKSCISKCLDVLPWTLVDNPFDTKCVLVANDKVSLHQNLNKLNDPFVYLALEVHFHGGSVGMGCFCFLQLCSFVRFVCLHPFCSIHCNLHIHLV